MDPELVERIYESSFVPELWPGVLDELSKIAVARAGFLFISNAEIHHWAASTELANEAVKPLVASGWIARSQRMSRFLGARHSGFLVDYDIYIAEEMDVDPFYRDVLRSRGLGWSTGTAIPLPTGDNLSFVLEREYVRGPVEPVVVAQLNELRPHLARGGLMSARLQLERARAASEALALIGLSALVLNEQGKVLAANHLIEGLTGYVHWRAQDRVSLKDRAADNLLRDAIAAIGVAGSAGVRSFPVRDTGAEAMMVAHVIPIRLSARDIFVRCAAALILTPVTLPQAPPVELVQSLFDLTPAEARVARGLASGETVETIASARGVSQNTVRMQVRGVLEKTGCNRQVDIVALLTAISPARLTHPA
jgi:DNA-binding CsgD family transcriptional regulator